MEKVFEALEEIGNVDLGDNPYKKFDTNKLKNIYNKEFNILEQALTELKQIKEAKPSEALRAYEYIKVHLDVTDIRGSIYDFEENLKTICLFLKNARELEHRTLLKTQELEKENAEYKEVLRIIFEKKVEMNLLINSNTLGEYNANRNWGAKELTQEEFDLLKHYLEKNIQKQ